MSRSDYHGDPGTIAVEYELRKTDLSMGALSEQIGQAMEHCKTLPGLDDRVSIREAGLLAEETLPDGLTCVDSLAADVDLSEDIDGSARLSVTMNLFRYEEGSAASKLFDCPVASNLLLPSALGMNQCFRADGSPLSGQSAAVRDGQWIRFSTTDPETGKAYNVAYKASSPYEDTRDFFVLVEDIAGSEIIQFGIDYAFGESAEKFLNGMGDVSQTLSYINLVLESNDIQSDYNEMVRQIYRTVPPEQREEALKQAKAIRSGRSDYLAGTMAMGAMFGYMASAGLFAGPAGMAMAAIMMGIALGGKYFSKYSPDSIFGGLFSGKWAQDPSGYVYEAVTANRVAGVTATAYWIPEPEDADSDAITAFYAKKPAASETGAVWDAAEYDQSNPLTTDSNGAYAWDVPCGWWRVMYEKDGYDRAYSDWLPVPPPQLEVNVPLVSRTAPTLESVEAESDRVEVTFSKYMQPETVEAALTLNGRSVQVTWPTDETDADGNIYARTFTLIPEAALAENSTAVVAVTAQAQSYAAVPAVSGSLETRVGGAPGLELPELVYVRHGGTVQVPIAVNNVDNPVVTAVSGLDAVAGVTVNVSEDGSGFLTVSGKLPGAATVTVRVANTNLTASLTIRVVRQMQAPQLGTPQWAPDAGTVTVDVQCDQAAMATAAVYSAEGRFLGLETQAVSGNQQLTFRELPQGEQLTVFLLTQEHIPLCPAAEIK